eukprot:TRINITY_DN628_c0_g1_i3.p1 TRINITY_DN628_c0_g1~~TRINITY_DN628_c0_g1_i3.p1  ORF type:complete len:353 (-),score=60.62 TRINITY_DN628_c0_g1_i3:1439-2440(-)
MGDSNQIQTIMSHFSMRRFNLDFFDNNSTRRSHTDTESKRGLKELVTEVIGGCKAVHSYPETLKSATHYMRNGRKVKLNTTQKLAAKLGVIAQLFDSLKGVHRPEEITDESRLSMVFATGFAMITVDIDYGEVVLQPGDNRPTHGLELFKSFSDKYNFDNVQIKNCFLLVGLVVFNRAQKEQKIESFTTLVAQYCDILISFISRDEIKPRTGPPVIKNQDEVNKVFADLLPLAEKILSCSATDFFEDVSNNTNLKKIYSHASRIGSGNTRRATAMNGIYGCFHLYDPLSYASFTENLNIDLILQGADPLTGSYVCKINDDSLKRCRISLQILK